MLRPSNPLLRILALVALATVPSCDNAAVSPESPDRSSPDVAGVSLARVADYTPWEAPIRVDLIPGVDPDFNTAANDGCPFISPDGKSFYMASNRADPTKPLDIWVATRESEGDAWGKPVNVESVNSELDDFCPTISRDGHLLYFASRRPGGCGGSDLYVARRRADHGFDPPEMLPCDATPPYDAVNSPADEWGPFPINDGPGGPTLYFSSFRPGGFAPEAIGGVADSDVYLSRSHGGVYGPVDLVENVNTAADDGQPNVSSDGLELFFYSTRVVPGSSGAADLYVATRAAVTQPWSTPANLGPVVNAAGGETRPSLSWDGTTLYFGSVRPAPAVGKGASDIYMTKRSRVTGSAP